MDHEQVERETHMLKLLAAMVDGFNAIKFFQAHRIDVGLGKCEPCVMATTLAAIKGLEADDTLTAFRDTLCPAMQEATDQILQAEFIARDVKQAIDEVANRVKNSGKN